MAERSLRLLMRIEPIRARAGHYLYSQHADIERQAGELTFAQIEEALLHCECCRSRPTMKPWESCDHAY